MFDVLTKNLSRLRKENEDTGKVLGVRHRERSLFISNKALYEESVKEAHSNYSYLKNSATVVDINQYRDLLDVIKVTEAELSKINNGLLECNREIVGLEELIKNNDQNIGRIILELEKYGKVIQFPKPINRQSP